MKRLAFKALGAAVVVASLSGNQLAAANVTGHQLQAYCTGPENSPGRVACVSYIQGFVGGIEAGDGSKVRDGRLWCFPDGATIKQARLVIEKYMRDNPQSIHRDADVIVGAALKLAFPCKIEY